MGPLSAGPKSAVSNKNRGNLPSLCFVVILLIAVAVAFLFPKKALLDPLKIESGTYRFATYQQIANSKNETYIGYVSLFAIVYPDYLSYGKSEARQQLEEIAKEAKKKFRKEYKDTDFVIPCLDNGCASIEYDPEIKEIEAEVSSIPTLEYIHMSLAVNKLRSLKYFDHLEEDQAIALYNDAYKSTAAFYERTREEKLEGALEKLETFIAKKFPESYRIYKEQKYYEYK